jgi:NAD(P)-dependent dehydrogenase (short-subunit alcohol dehydrogenase family)
MNSVNLSHLFDLSDRIAVITGGGGVLCSTLGYALAQAGVKVAVLDISAQAAQKAADEIHNNGGQAIWVQCDVLDKTSVERAAEAVVNAYGRVDILLNGAGGNQKGATTSHELPFFDLPMDAIRDVFNLNFMGTMIPCQIFGKWMANQGSGVILNISSMNAFRPLTRIPAYSAAKSAVSNFTQWLAVYMAQEYSSSIRVNAIAPGFFLTQQNRFLLIDEKTGEWSSRGRAIIEHTPMGRFGVPDDLIGTVLWLLSTASNFVTGIVVPVDGGFSSFSGV